MFLFFWLEDIPTKFNDSIVASLSLCIPMIPFWLDGLDDLFKSCSISMSGGVDVNNIRKEVAEALCTTCCALLAQGFCSSRPS